MTALYNEIENYPARWLVNLSAAGKIAKGVVIEDDIRNLRAHHLENVTQAHFFAGIGVWSYALRLAGWPDDLPVWTGSCPCQPFSVAGRGKGTEDARHLWPDWFRLIDECRPPVIFGEQVASPAGLDWFDAVSADLERAGYAVGAADLCAAGVGAPHIRQRLYFVAVADRERRQGLDALLRRGRQDEDLSEATKRAAPGGLAHGDHRGSQERGEQSARQEQPTFERGSEASILGDSGDEGSWWDARTILSEEREGCSAWRTTRRLADELELAGATRGFWRGADWLYCRDRRLRPVEPGSFPLAHGASARVGRTSAYGNAIVAQVAATFIRAVMETL
ncbi:MAG: DNA cytosine methyltransferase [Spirochaetes bacterium]|nr:MAG: DNA cytosine methyltransferase [Spirochaetota bacterium]